MGVDIHIVGGRRTTQVSYEHQPDEKPANWLMIDFVVKIRRRPHKDVQDFLDRCEVDYRASDATPVFIYPPLFDPESAGLDDTPETHRHPYGEHMPELDVTEWLEKRWGEEDPEIAALLNLMEGFNNRRRPLKLFCYFS